MRLISGPLTGSAEVARPGRRSVPRPTSRSTVAQWTPALESLAASHTQLPAVLVVLGRGHPGVGTYAGGTMTGANVDPVSRPDHEALLAHLCMSVATRTTVTLSWRGCERAPSNLTECGEAAPRGRPYCVVSRAGAPLRACQRHRRRGGVDAQCAWAGLNASVPARWPAVVLGVSVIDRTLRDWGASSSDVHIQSGSGGRRAWTVKLTQIGWLGARLSASPSKLLCRLGMGATRSS